MKIKQFLVLVCFFGILGCSFLSFKSMEYERDSKNNKLIKNINIIDYRCRRTTDKSSSVVDIFYNGKIYSLGITSGLCNDLKEYRKEPQCYYDKDKDDIIFLNQNYYRAYAILVFIFLLILPVLGFYIYRNELNNSYKTM